MKSKDLFKFATLLVAGLISAAAAFAQGPSKVSGKVSDEDGNPLAGVYVLAKGTTVATTTNGNGEFELSVPASATALTFSMLGMEDQETVLGNRAFFDVVMSVDSQALEETVVIGYGTIIKKELSASVSSVSGEALSERASALNALQGLAGKMAGVSAFSRSGRPGQSIQVRVRGTGSINASADPLYVVDGVVDVDPNMVNPSDIESMDVLKDAAATAVYGAKGANGVVIITTKSGTKGKASVSFDTKTGVNIVTRRLSLLDADQYMDCVKAAYAYEGKTMPHLLDPESYEYLFNYQKNADGSYFLGEDGLPIASPKYNTNWQDEIFKKGIITNNTVNVNGGDDKTTYYASIGYANDQGALQGSSVQHFSATANVRSQINKWLDIAAMISGGQDKRNSADNEGSFGSGICRKAMEALPIYPVKWEDGSYSHNGYPSSPGTNPYEMVDGISELGNNKYLLMNLEFNVHFTDHLKLTVNGNYQTKDYKKSSVWERGLMDFTQSNNGLVSLTNQHTNKWSNEDYLTYENTWGKWKANLVLGTSFYYSLYEDSSQEVNDIDAKTYSYYNMAAGSVIKNPSSNQSKVTMNSFYFRMNHVWDGKYMLGATFRADGASNFGANNKYGFFPSVSAAWALSEEPWFKKDVVNHFKLRLSYGHVGNASIDPYQTYSQYGTGSIYFNNTKYTSSTLNNLGNQDLRWETAKQFDAGFDMSLANDRIQLIGDFYIKRNCDLLYTRQVPWSTGYATTMDNIGEIKNTGVEFTINAHTIDNPEFKWDTDFIFSYNNCIAVNLNGDMFTSHGGMTRGYEGKPWLNWYTYNRVGIWGSDEAEQAAVYGQNPGDYHWEDVNNDGKIDEEDLVEWGRSVPPFEASFVNTFSWKGFTLGIDLGGKFGAWVHNRSAQQCDQMFTSTNGTTALLKAWTYENQNTIMPALRLESDTNGGWIHSDSYYMERGDFVRIRNISLNYDFKHRVLRNSKAIKGLRIGANVENAYVFTKYTGYDPELSWSTDFTGMDVYSYPRPMIVTGNLRITF